jgi:endonuclease-3
LQVRDSVDAVIKALEAAFGIPHKEGTGDPLDGLILTILSQNTNDRNRDRAYQRLKERFPDWEAVLEAGSAALEDSIRVAGLGRTKSRRIIQLLEDLKCNQGKITLEGLRYLPPQEAEKALLAIPGVGKKTARCILLFELDVPAFPVDTHVLRVTRRIGWVPQRATAARVHDILQGIVPPAAMHSLHLNLIHLGRTVCRPRNPRCPECPIHLWCQYGGGELSPEHEAYQQEARL